MQSDEAAVLKILGQPSAIVSRSTAKAFIPFYFGSDRRHVEWIYAGVGRVVFSQNHYTGRLSVIEVSAE